MPRPRSSLFGLLLCLAFAIGLTLFVRIGGAGEPRGELVSKDLDLGQGVLVQARTLGPAHLKFIVIKVPRRSGVKLRAVQVPGGLWPLEKIAGSVGAVAAVNGDYHEMHGYLLGKTYSSIVTGGDSKDLSRYKVVGPPEPNDASFWLDEERVPHISRLDLEASIGIVASVTQGLNHRRCEAVLVPDPLPGKHALAGEVAFPLEKIDVGFRVKATSSRVLEGPSLVVRGDAVARVATAVAPGTVLSLSVKKRVDLAIGTGPHLLESGKIPGPVFDGDEAWSHHPRTAVGLSKDAVFLVATVQVPHNRSSMVDLAKALQELGCTDAVNLDGGPSTALCAKGQIVNVAPGFEGISDRVGSGLCVVPGKEGVDDVR